jgi:hypothetical protein
MKAKVQDILKASATFGKLYKVESLPFGTKRKVKALIKDAKDAIDDFNEEKDKALKRIGVPAKDDDGKEIPSKFTLEGKAIDDFRNALLELENAEIDFSDKIDIPAECELAWFDVVDDKIVSRSLSAEDLDLLDPFISIKE